MKIKLVTIIASVMMISLLLSAYQPSNAVSYYNHDGSVDKNMSKYKVEPIKGKKDWWYYAVKVCANDYTMGVAGVILKSDIDMQILGINKNIKKGDCKVYGTTMKAKDSKTLGGDLIEKHEAIKRMLDLKNGFSGLSKSQKMKAFDEWNLLYNMIGMHPR